MVYRFLHFSVFRKPIKKQNEKKKKKKNQNVIKRKNDIIARAIQDILLSGADSTKIRDQVVGVLTKFNTPTLSLETRIVQPG